MAEHSLAPSDGGAGKHSLAHGRSSSGMVEDSPRLRHKGAQGPAEYVPVSFELVGLAAWIAG